MKKERYNKEVPYWLRLIGCFGIEDSLYRFRWGEFKWGWALGAGYSVYHETAHVFIYPLIFKLYVNAPMLITQGVTHEDWCAHYGFSIYEDWDSIHFNWRSRCKIIDMPWAWKHVRHSFLNQDGSLHHHAKERGYEPPPVETKTTHEYIYKLKRGTDQIRTATINGEEREWRWRWFTWLSWPRKISRSINIEFNEEVGERSGSWKGGCTGCGWDWHKDESQSDALRRMEAERKF